MNRMVTMDKIINIFKVLSDQTRLRILVLLYQEELCVCEFTGVLDIPQPKISKGLSKLRDLNLVFDERREKFVFYSIDRDNDVLMSILTDIVKSMDDYPQLKKDQERLADKQKYLDNCNPISVL